MSKIKLKYIVSTTKGEQINIEDYFYSQQLYPFANGGEKYSGFYDKYNRMENSVSMSEGGEKAGTIIWNITKYWSGAHNYTFIPKNKLITQRQLFWMLTNCSGELRRTCQNVGIPGLKKEILENFLMVLPSKQTSDYLDKKCAVIDKTITLYQKKIDLLSKYKKSLISECINKNDKRERLKMKYIAFIQRGERITFEDFSSTENLYPIQIGGEQYSGFYDKYNRLEDTTSFVGYGSVGAVIWHKTKYWSVDTNYTFTLKNREISQRQLFWMLINSADDVKVMAKNVGIQGIDTMTLANVKFNIVSKQTSDYLDKKCAVIDKTIDLTSKKVSLLEKYRKSLISEQINGGVYA